MKKLKRRLSGVRFAHKFLSMLGAVCPQAPEDIFRKMMVACDKIGARYRVGTR